MRHHASSAPVPVADSKPNIDWRTLRALFPYLWAYKGRVMLALICMVLGKAANVYVPIIFKRIIDALTMTKETAVLVVPASLLLIYGVLRLSSSLMTELREILFARVTQEAVRAIALKVFRHLQGLSLRFHLDRQTGGLTRDIERGTRAVSTLIGFTLYSILPTIVEIGLVIGILLVTYHTVFAVTTLITLAFYVVFTIGVTNWRTALRRRANELDSAANARAIDSLINFETVKYFNNEDFETERYDAQLKKWTQAQIVNQVSLSLLNVGQAVIIAVGVTVMMWQAAQRVTTGEMTIGDIVLVNGFLIQLYLPLNFLGVMYRELRQALTDIERLFGLLDENREIADAPDAQVLAPGPASIVFDAVSFAYNPDRTILYDVSFEVPAGRTVAVVGHSGSGKSTLARLLYRFYDVTGGSIRINGQDLRHLTQHSLRSAIGIVPQDTVLFNDTLLYNVQYGRPDASEADIQAAIEAAQLTQFIARLPEGMETRVGERGLKLSGGEKQRVAIARALLKDPTILIFDEATSALDSQTEKAIQSQLEQAAQGRTALVIAHRLSTIMKADEIIVLDQGRVVERGTHSALLARAGTYAQLWQMQQDESEQMLAESA